MLRLLAQNHVNNSDKLKTLTGLLPGQERPKAPTSGNISTPEHGELPKNLTTEDGCDACSIEADKFLSSLQATQSREEAIASISWHGRKFIGSGEDCYA